MPPSSDYDIVALGNPVVDILAHVEESFLARHQLRKGATHLVDAHAIEALYNDLGEEGRHCSGGSAANTAVAMAELGHAARFIGRVAADARGSYFTREIREVGVDFTPATAPSDPPTACCVVCVTPDGERTMSVYIGASAEFSAEDLDEEPLQRTRLLYIEGYLWDAPAAKEAIRHAMALAREGGATIALSLSDIFCVNRHREEFASLIAGEVDILFANGEEATALHQSAPLAQVVTQLQQQVHWLAVTQGSAPAFVCQKSAGIQSQPPPVPCVEDATGAGDLFAAGFLSGVLQACTLEACATRGHRLAAHIIQQLGARSDTRLRGVLPPEAPA